MRVLALLVLALVAGCAALRPHSGEALQVRDIVGAAVDAARASPEDQRRRLASAQRRFAAAPDDASRVRLAVLLATLPPPGRDDARAASLLEPLAARRPESPLTQLARMLAVSIAERQKLVLDLRAAELRVQAAELRSQSADLRAETAERREAAAVERAETLHRQVETLKSIERGILQREERRRNLQR
jgi:hypothetical protein